MLFFLIYTLILIKKLIRKVVFRIEKKMFFYYVKQYQLYFLIFWIFFEKINLPIFLRTKIVIQ